MLEVPECGYNQKELGLSCLFGGGLQNSVAWLYSPLKQENNSLIYVVILKGDLYCLECI